MSVRVILALLSFFPKPRLAWQRDGDTGSSRGLCEIFQVRVKKKREGKEKWEDGKMGEAQPGEDRWNNRRMDVWARWRRERRKKKIWTGRACQFMWSVCMCDFSCMRAPDWVSLPLFAVRIKHTAPTHAHSQAYRGARLWGTLTRERMKRKKKKTVNTTAAEMMSTFNNSSWRLHHKNGCEDKDSLLCGVGNCER